MKRKDFSHGAFQKKKKKNRKGRRRKERKSQRVNFPYIIQNQDDYKKYKYDF